MVIGVLYVESKGGMRVDALFVHLPSSHRQNDI